MDGLQFTSSIIGSLAWPLAVVVVALLFREQVKALLAKVKIAKGAGLEFQFAEELKTVVAEAQAVTLPQPPLEAASDLNLPPPPTVEDGVRALMSKEPSATILKSWKGIEGLMRKIATDAALKLPHGDPRFRSPRQLIEGLYRHEIINDEAADILHKLYNLRNHVAHNSIEPALDEAVDYYWTAVKAIEILKAVKVDASSPSTVR